VVIRPHRWSGAPGTEIAVDVQAFDVHGAARQGTLQWESWAAAGQITAPGGAIRVPLPVDAVGREVDVQVRWLDEGGQTLAADSAALSCPQAATVRPALHVVDDEPLADALAALDYPLAADETAIWVARNFTPACREAVKQGGRLLLITDGADEQSLPVGHVFLRAGTSWQGDWASSFSWLRRDGPFAGLPGGPLLDMGFEPVMPTAVLAGLPAWLMRDQSWAGLAVGWLHKHVSLLATMRYGLGEMAVTTFRLTPEVLAADAVAQALFAGMMALLTPVPG